VGHSTFILETAVLEGTRSKARAIRNPAASVGVYEAEEPFLFLELQPALLENNIEMIPYPYSYCTASTMFVLAAERAGRSPAKTPMRRPENRAAIVGIVG
jgi:hypothetical protein